MRLEKIKNKTLTWEKLTRPSKKNLETSLGKYKFNDLHLTDCLPPIQRPRLSSDYDYLFMILNFPVYKNKTKEIEPMELDFFIGKDYIITVQDQAYAPLDDLFEELRKNPTKQKKATKSPGYLVFEILNACLIGTVPLLNILNVDIAEIEKKIFQKNDKDTIREILNITRNIVAFRKSIMAHKSVIRKFIDKSSSLFPINGLSDYFSELINYTKEIWDSLDNYKETIDALQQSHNSLHSWKLNEIIKTLTIFSVVIFSLTLFAAIFAIRLDSGMPFVNSSWSFWKFLGLEAGVSLIILAIFKRKHWL